MAALQQRKHRRTNKRYLPAAPLAEAVLKLAARSDLKTVCERAGIPERVITRWDLGECNGNVELGLADQVMTRLDLFWWEVWTEDTVREPLFVVTTYHAYWKRDKVGDEYKLRRIKDRTIPYGDLGTDFWRLREIRRLLSGELEVAA